jgi:antitoxin HigA-1
VWLVPFLNYYSRHPERREGSCRDQILHFVQDDIRLFEMEMELLRITIVRDKNSNWPVIPANPRNQPVGLVKTTTGLGPCRGLSRRSQMKTKIPPNIHPGEVLLEEFLLPMEFSQYALARATGVPPRRINEIVLGKRGITSDTALCLARAFGTSEGFWLGLQADCDLEVSRKKIGADVDQIERLAA